MNNGHGVVFKTKRRWHRASFSATDSSLSSDKYRLSGTNVYDHTKFTFMDFSRKRKGRIKLSRKMALVISQISQWANSRVS